MRATIGNNVPDYRGRFLRHAGGNSAALGVAQGDAIRNFTGQFSSDENYYNGGNMLWGESGVFYGVKINNSGVARFQSVDARGRSRATRIDASRQVPTAGEIRPANIAVKYIICAEGAK